ncbi:MAG: cell division protein FtsK [Denitrovibrio sp.]|nr:MAG: cell division protein FtsK [Denitrovibrio sp.]
MDVENKGLKADIIFLIILFFTIFATLSIYSHSEIDPGWSLIIFSNYDQEVVNLFGKTGAYFSDFLATIFGWASNVLPIIFIWLTVRLHFHRRNQDMKWKKTTFRFFLYILLCLTLATMTGFFGGSDFSFASKPMGGLAGLFSADFFNAIVGTVGGIVITCFIITLILFVLFPKFFMKLARTELPKRAKKAEPVEDIEYQGEIPGRQIKADFESEPIVEEEPEAYEEPEPEFEPEPIYEEEIDEPLIKEPYEEPSIKEIQQVEKVKGKYNIPIKLLDEPVREYKMESEDELKLKGEMLVSKLADFGVNGKIREIQPGPVVTLYEFEPAPGVKINKIANLSDDLALAMSAVSVRIIAPIPGKSVVGIELPNKSRAMVFLSELMQSKEFTKGKAALPFAMGKDISGKAYVSDLASMPHLLVAGTTGSGKSVAVNTLICSIVYHSPPELVKFIMVDPKMVELSIYEDIPHLAAPVVTDPRKAANVLKNVVEEMENRYSALAAMKVRNLASYNQKAEQDPELPIMPFLVVIVDEFADLMLFAGKEVEQSIIRIAQMARAVGIHLVLATQRPSVNVITGIIKANMPARLSFRVSSKVDSRTIIDTSGAELLLGKGDSLFIPPGMSDTLRVHGCFVSDDEVGRIVEHLKSLGEPEYNMDLVKEEVFDPDEIDDSELDEKYDEALTLVKQKGFASISMVQRYLRIGYNRAARIVEIMEKRGIIAPSDGTSKPRELLIKD